MTQIRSFADANIELAKYIPRVKEVTGKDITLDRMVPLMTVLGNPQDKLKIIHIAGTSGKTSTAYYTASLLQAAGQKVGLTVSPHIQTVTERLQINLQPLNEREFCTNLNEFLHLIKNVDPQPTYFELLVAFAYWYFAKSGVDYAVIETGLGGLHDATNIAGNLNKVCVITDIGLDHTKVLGKTIKAITAQKAGIIHKNNEVFYFWQSPTVRRVLQEVGTQQNAKLHEILSRDINEETQSLPLFQRRNWYLANTIFNFIAQRDNLPKLTKAQLSGSMAIRIPARMEVVNYKNKTIILDGAHNPQKLRALISSINHSYPGQPVAVLAGFVQSRPQRLHGNLRELLKLANHLVVTSFVPNQEMYTKSADPSKIAQYCRAKGFTKTNIEPVPRQAFEVLIRRPEPVLLITGSFYLLHHFRPLIINTND